MDVNEIIKMIEKSLPDEELFSEIIRDLVKDEIKEMLKEKLEKNPEIKKEIKESLMEYVEGKFLEISASTKFTKAVAKLGLISMPKEFKNEMINTVISTFQKEISEAIDKTL